MQSIVIRAYQESWPADFEALRADLMRALGPVAKRIAHIGSTGVPGMGAKDIIDIQVGVDALHPTCVDLLTSSGYEYVSKHSSDHVPPGESASPIEWQKLYFRNTQRSRACHVHLRVPGRANHRYALLFRDYLRAHGDARATVELIKRELARLHGGDQDAYYAVKDPVYDLVWHAAKSWAERTGWSEAVATDA